MKISELLEQTKNFTWREKLKFVSEKFPTVEEAAFSTSFSIEDQVITDAVVTHNLPIKIFTLDSGRLPNQTYQVWQATLEKYREQKIAIEAYYPNADEIREFVTAKGINPFYDSKEMRLKCCEIRKVKPLHQALAGKKIWISGIRRDHSPDRANKDFFEYDEGQNIVKFYPLLNLSEEEVWAEIKQRNIPYNSLYDKGYRSIGCDPCTRAVAAGEDVRAGRWWWEDESGKECGLHVVDGRLVRKKTS